MTDEGIEFYERLLYNKDITIDELHFHEMKGK